MEIALPPQLQNVLIAIVATGVVLLLVIHVWRRRRAAPWVRSRAAPSPEPEIRAITPEEWKADFDRTISELLGIDPGASPSKGAGEGSVGPLTNGASSPNGAHRPSPGGAPGRSAQVPDPHGRLSGRYPPPPYGPAPYRPPFGAAPYGPAAPSGGGAPYGGPYDPAPYGGPGPEGVDTTLHLLPGRLEAISGFHGHEVRFVHRGGVPRFTFGRSPGPPFEHVQILAPTVSRLHAYMEYVDGQWYIGNLSFTNAVLVNGRPVVGEETVLLRDGDYVEMGEVVFVFRER